MGREATAAKTSQGEEGLSLGMAIAITRRRRRNYRLGRWENEAENGQRSPVVRARIPHAVLV